MIFTGHTSHECINGYGKFRSNPYDVGLLKNFQLIFGKNPLAILWPFLAPKPTKDFIFALNDNAIKYFTSKKDNSNRMNSISNIEEEKMN